MKKPKYKFELLISEPTTIREGYKINVDGSIVQDSKYFNTELIVNKEVIISPEYDGCEAIIAEYEIVEGSAPSFVSAITITKLTRNNNIINAQSQRGYVVYIRDNALHHDSLNTLYIRYNVHPVFKSIKKVYERGSSQMFMREKLSGQVSFMQGTFDVIYNQQLDASMRMRIYKYNYTTGLYEHYYSSCRFTKMDCKFDVNRRKASLPLLEPDDQYTKILSNYDTEYDLEKLNARDEIVQFDIGMMQQFYITGGSHITNVLSSGEYYDTEVEPLELEQGQSYILALREYGFFPHSHCCEMRFDGGSFAAANGLYVGSNPQQYYVGPYGGVATADADNTSYQPYNTAVSDNDIDYVIKIAQVGQTYHVVLASKSNQNNILYKSQVPLQAPYPDIYSLTDYIAANAGRIVMISTADPQKRGAIFGYVSYEIYSRTLVTQYLDNTQLTYLSPDDFAYPNGNYKCWLRLEQFPHVVISQSISDTSSGFGIRTPGEYFTDKNLFYSDRITRYVPVCISEWGNCSLWFPLEGKVSGSFTTWKNFTQPYFANVGSAMYSVCTALKALLKKIDNRIVFNETAQHSEFFYGFYNVITTTPLVPLITQLTNMTRGTRIQRAQHAEISISSIMGLLRDAFRVYWYIDEQYNLHLEHVSWFNNGGTNGLLIPEIAVNSLADQFTKKNYDDVFGEIEYDSTELYNNIDLSYAIETTEMFGSQNVEIYDGCLYNTGHSDVSIGDFCANFDYMFANGRNLGEDGFAVAYAKRTINQAGYNIYKIPREEYTDQTMTVDGIHFYKINTANTYMIKQWLMKHYMYDFAGYTLSTPQFTAVESKRVVKQKIELPLENDPNKYCIIMTRFGNGLLTQLSLDLDTRHAEIVLMHRRF